METCSACLAEEDRELSAAPVCVAGTDVYFDSCEDIKTLNLGDVVIGEQGRVLDVTAMLRQICPGKRVAVAVGIYELEADGTVHPRGIKTVLVPAHNNPGCVDLQLPSLRFVLPEEASAAPSAVTCGKQRHFTVRVDAHYADLNGSGS